MPVDFKLFFSVVVAILISRAVPMLQFFCYFSVTVSFISIIPQRVSDSVFRLAAAYDKYGANMRLIAILYTVCQTWRQYVTRLHFMTDFCKFQKEGEKPEENELLWRLISQGWLTLDLVCVPFWYAGTCTMNLV